MARKGEDELEFISVVDHTGRITNNNVSAGYNAAGFNTSSDEAGRLGFIRHSNHPVAALFHVAFKLVALFTYIFGGIFSSNFVFICVICIVTLAFDFWTVKNITGRLMVGLRWWSYVKEDGTNEWVFESLENMAEIKPSDSKLFWVALYATPAVWGCLFIVGLLKFNLQWLVIVVVALTLSVANIIGYTKCSKDAKQRVKGFMADGMQRGAAAALGDSSVRNLLFSFFTGPTQPTNNSVNTV